MVCSVTSVYFRLGLCARFKLSHYPFTYCCGIKIRSQQRDALVCQKWWWPSLWFVPETFFYIFSTLGEVQVLKISPHFLEWGQNATGQAPCIHVCVYRHSTLLWKLEPVAECLCFCQITQIFYLPLENFWIKTYWRKRDVFLSASIISLSFSKRKDSKPMSLFLPKIQDYSI
jgi:hypothetical protein